MPDPDTAPAARRVQLALLRRRTPEERVRTAMAMSEEAREVTKTGIRSRHPAWSENRLQRALLALVYGPDLVARAWGPTKAE